MRSSFAVNFLNISLGLSALLVSALLVRSELRGRSNATSLAPNRLFLDSIPTTVDYFGRGQLVGPASGKPALVVFSDYQCPACKMLHTELEQRRARGEHDLTILYRHWPLPRHQFALKAAVASERAALQGRFPQMHDSLFEQSAEMGSLSNAQLTAMAGVLDKAAFHRCLQSDSITNAVRSEEKLAQQIGSKGTPTVVLRDGKAFVGVPPARVLDSLVKELSR